MGNFVKALEHHQRALEINLRVYTRTLWPPTRTLGSSTKKKAEYPEALDMYRKALVIDQKVHGPEHPDVATTLMNMGKVYDE